MSSTSQERRHGWLLLVSAVLGFLACVTQNGKHQTPRQSWWAERGPVVPHDSFPSDCSLCHEGSSWHAIREDFEYDHLAETGVELVGRHAEAECLRCHNDRGPVARYAERGCAGCHEDVHRGQLGQDCSGCHDETSWDVVEIIATHNRTRFPLVGAHVSAACWRCHPGADVGNFSNADTECITCHLADLARATDPDHATSGFGDDCDRCHIPTAWTGSAFNHGIYPLTGAHAGVDCSLCHVGGVFAGTPRDCSACHLDDYNGTTDPDHVADGFSTDCEDCHNTSGWTPAFFNHSGIVNGCVDCHLDDYNGTDDPDHALEGYSTDCEDCHSTNSWTPAMFNHTGIVDGCSVCHLDDYNDSSDPNHTAAMFPTTCETCHNTNTWFGAVFDHDFPIASGRHAFDCSECHLNPTDYSTFSCIDCHEHRQSEADDEHDDVNDYVWESGACYMCHPDGND